MKTLILGNGEVGKALYDVLSPFYKTAAYDVDPPDLEGVEIMHICFPWTRSFIDTVLAYKERYKPRLTVIHSTVPVGTSTACGATHSPIRGNHADMARSIRTFAKFVGGRDASEVAEYFNRAGIRPIICQKSDTTELAKILCTTAYGVWIEYTLAVKAKCDAERVPFAEAWTLWQQTYNEGYQAIGRPEYTRPILAPIERPIGGHCVLPNLDLIEFGFADIVRTLNRERNE